MHREDFDEDEKDENWLPVIARRGWVILSKDEYNYLERQAIKNAHGRAFHLVRAELPGAEQAAIICKALLQSCESLTSIHRHSLPKSTETVRYT